MWNSTAQDVDELEHKIDVLHRHCETVGREPAQIRMTVGLLRDPFEDLDDYLRTIERYAELGIGLINVGPLPGNQDPVGFIRRLADEVVPKVATIA